MSDTANQLARRRPPALEHPLILIERIVHATIFGDEDTPDACLDEVLETDNFEELWALDNALSSLRKAGYLTFEAINRAMKRNLKGDVIRMDDTIVMPIPEDAQASLRNEEDFWRYLDVEPDSAVAMMFRGTQVRVSLLRAIARERGDDPDEIEDRFITYPTDRPTTIRRRRMEYAPHWALDLEHNERRTPPRKDQP